MATSSSESSRLAQTLGHLPLQTSHHASQLTRSDILGLSIFTSSYFPPLDEMSLLPRPFRVKLNLSIHDALVLEALADSLLQREIKSLELQPGRPLAGLKASTIWWMS